MLLGLMIIATNDVSAQKTNVALNKPTTQSSLYSESFPASRAVDGITTGRNPDFTHTKDGTDPWWQVDLGAVYDVEEIVIWNRTDCCWERLKNYYVMLSETPITSNSTTKNVVSKGSFSANTPNVTTNFGVNGKKGRFIRIFTQNGTMPLSLAEVQVFAKEKANSASNVQKLPEAKSLENNIAGYWGIGRADMLIFRQGELKHYTYGKFWAAYSYRVLDNSTVELTDKAGKKSVAKVPFFDNSTLVWDEPSQGRSSYKRMSGAEIEASDAVTVLKAYLQAHWIIDNSKMVLYRGEMKIYGKNGDLESTTSYKVLDENTVELTGKDGKKRLVKVISIDPNAELIWDDPNFGRRVFKRFYSN